MGYQILTGVYDEVDDERGRQWKKWGESNILRRDPHGAVSVLTEEVGEVAKATLERDYLQMRVELIQVAAVALEMINNYDHGLYSGGR